MGAIVFAEDRGSRLKHVTIDKEHGKQLKAEDTHMKTSM